MASPRWDNHDVSGDDSPGLAVGSAEQHRRLAGHEAEHLMRIAVEVVKRENSVAPAAAPAVAREQLLAPPRVTDNLEHVVPDDDWERRVIGDPLARIESQ